MFKPHSTLTCLSYCAGVQRVTGDLGECLHPLFFSFLQTGGVTTLGRIGVSALSSLQHLHPSPPTHPPSTSHPSLLDLDYGLSLGAEETGGSGEWRPGFGRHCKAFPLDYCPSCGHSCLVYNTSVDGERRVLKVYCEELYTLALVVG